MPFKTFEVKTYEVNMGFRNTASWGGVGIQIQGYVVGRSSAGERLIVYGLNPSSPVPPNPVCNFPANVGAIFVPFAQLGQYVDLLRNEKPLMARIDSDNPGWMSFYTGSGEPVGEGE